MTYPAYMMAFTEKADPGHIVIDRWLTRFRREMDERVKLGTVGAVLLSINGKTACVTLPRRVNILKKRDGLDSSFSRAMKRIEALISMKIPGAKPLWMKNED